MAKTSPSQPQPVVLSTNCIVDGVFIPAGSPVPFAREEDLPDNLKAVVATGDEVPPFHPAERNIYEHLRPELRRQARQVLGNVQFQAWAEEHAGPEPLPPETQAVLEDEHTLRIAKVKAQMEFNRAATDAAYESAVRQAEEVRTQFFVRRGGEWAKVQNARLKPGETTFVKRPSGEFEASGYVDANGTPPDPEIYL